MTNIQSTVRDAGGLETLFGRAYHLWSMCRAYGGVSGGVSAKQEMEKASSAVADEIGR